MQLTKLNTIFSLNCSCSNFQLNFKKNNWWLKTALHQLQTTQYQWDQTLLWYCQAGNMEHDDNMVWWQWYPGLTSDVEWLMWLHFRQTVYTVWPQKICAVFEGNNSIHEFAIFKIKDSFEIYI